MKRFPASIHGARPSFRLPSAALLALALAGASCARAADKSPAGPWESGGLNLLPRAFQANPHIDVMIVTEFAAAGRLRPAASPAHPQYYLQLPGQYTEVGDVVAGERKPPDAALAAILRKSLALAGYRPAGRTHPPTIALFYRWGSFNKLSNPADPAGADGPAPDDDLQVRNLVERVALVGGMRFAMDYVRAANAGTVPFFENRSARSQFLMQVARGNLYFVIADAYDYQAAAESRRVALWKTTISTDSRGITMDESVPQLIATAGPYFGHETDGPIRLNRPVMTVGKVLVGVPTVKEYLPSDAPLPPPPSAKPAAPAR